MLAAAAAALLLVAAAGMSRNRGGLGGLMDGAELRFTGVVSSVLERLGFGTPTADELLAAEASGNSGPLEAEVGPPVSASARSTSTPEGSVTAAKTRAPRTDLVLPAVVREEGVPRPDDGPVPIIEFATGEPLDVPAMVPNDLSVYTPANAEVRPPSFLRPQLPREPAADEDTGYFDIIVNEQGSVEQVKLLSPARRFQERMLVAAAKAWKFAPARLDGRPVRYRMRVPIILKGLP
jgi:hypothetical protein